MTLLFYRGHNSELTSSLGPWSISPNTSRTPPGGWRSTAKRHWYLYVFEALELAAFMVAVCIFSVLFFHRGYVMSQVVPTPLYRRVLMGFAMGITVLVIVKSPLGKRSGAHINPAVTLAYLRLNLMTRPDAFFYITFQFLGGLLGVGLARMLLGPSLADPSVNYVVTVPGVYGILAAFLAELLMAAGLMAMILWVSNQPQIARWTPYCVAAIVVIYAAFFSPLSGFSINPARTTGSAVFANLWTALWLYFVAPVVGTLASAELYMRGHGREHILCAKLDPDPRYVCPFNCCYPSHKGA